MSLRADVNSDAIVAIMNVSGHDHRVGHARATDVLDGADLDAEDVAIQEQNRYQQRQCDRVTLLLSM